MAIEQELIDELLSDYKNPEDLLGEGGIFKELKKTLLERALDAELSDHLGYEMSELSDAPATWFHHQQSPDRPPPCSC